MISLCALLRARVVDTSVTATDNSPSQDYTHPDDQTTPSHVTPGFKPFTAEHLRLDHDYLHCQMDNLGDVVDDLHRLVNHLQDGQRHLQDEQRRLHEAFQQLQEHLHVFKQDNLHQRQDDIKNALCVLKDVLEDLASSRDEQSAKANPPRNYERMIRAIKQALEPRNGDLAESDLFVTQRGNPSTETPCECNGSAQNLAFAQRVASLEKRADTIQEGSRRHEQKMESIEQTLALRNVTLADLEEYVRQQEIPSHDGQLLWRISDFSRKRNDAVNGERASIVSQSFSDSRFGYKMCARIYLNGDGMGKGTHISVYFMVMRGQYDALLSWPFRQKVTFMLLDQDNVKHVIDAFRPDPNSSSFQRPKRETNIADGCPMFFPLSELNNHAYVRDDTMFIKIIVDTDGL
ncbi:TNF receptor-associated factor 2 [Stylophora pistillata]|uniref:TNF receptor-associated factor 2 n=1 Tax=Stylophora pistillata TaxID=50429 RepID=A0A2B4RJT0_STYPI|nr:TNF receptor-associated factor 2 [Stylophora pistillata]